MRILFALAVGLVLGVGGVAAPVQSAPLVYAAAVDGDTVRVGATTVRIIGIDTPERGRCGYYGATGKMTRLIAGGVKIRKSSGKDRYGRTLAYLSTRTGRDVGTAMIRSGWAVARYDSRDGYDWHPKQRKYRSLDRKHNRKGVCIPGRTTPKKVKKPSSGPTYFANCDAARRAGAAPVRRGDPGYGRHLDRDGDGVGCE